MSYEQVKDLRPTDFKRYCGVEPETFRRMVELVSKRLTKERRKTGRPPKLSGKKKLQLADHEIDVVVVDVADDASLFSATILVVSVL
jgi:hypothetical protein